MVRSSLLTQRRQCAAVTTQSGLISVPPHRFELPQYSIKAYMHDHSAL